MQGDARPTVVTLMSSASIFLLHIKIKHLKKIICNIYFEHLEGSSLLVIKWQFSTYACADRVIRYSFKIVNEWEVTVADKSNKEK